MPSAKKLRFPWVSSIELTRRMGMTCEALRLAAELNLIKPGVDYYDVPSPRRINRAYNLETLRRNWPTISHLLPKKPTRSRKPLLARMQSCRNWDLEDES